MNNKKGIKIIFLIIIIVLLGLSIFSFYRESKNSIFKNEYSINETANIDDLDITLNNINYINNKTGIELTFNIKNKRDNTITITPEDYFKFYDINKVQIPNKYSNNVNIIKKNESLIYKLQYDVTEKELYEIYFYSQIAENNIKFSFKSQDIELDQIIESGSDKKEEKTIND